MKRNAVQMKLSVKWQRTNLTCRTAEQAVREIAGQERERAVTSEREAVREVARENLLQERLQQMERDMFRDLQKEKTLGGD